MTDKPVLLEKLKDEEYRLLILAEILDTRLHPWDEEYFNLYVLDEPLNVYWGEEQVKYPGYRYVRFNMENDQLAKEFAALVQRSILAFNTVETPKPKVLSGLLDF
jgi:hypothetical protein